MCGSYGFGVFRMFVDSSGVCGIGLGNVCTIEQLICCVGGIGLCNACVVRQCLIACLLGCLLVGSIGSLGSIANCFLDSVINNYTIIAKVTNLCCVL